MAMMNGATATSEGNEWEDRQSYTSPGRTSFRVVSKYSGIEVEVKYVIQQDRRNAV